ncbi:unnamed protein product [Ixodes persulcatus]
MVNTRKKKDAQPKVKEGPDVEFEECGRWCCMMETEFKTVAEAEESSFTCRSCEKVELGFGRIGREWADTVQELKREIWVEWEKRVQLEAQVGDLIKRAEADVEEMTREWGSKVDSVAGELRREREQRAELERQVEEWKVELEEHKKKCEEMVQQLTGVVNKKKGEVAADRCDGVFDCVGKEPAQLYSAAVQQGSRKAAEVEAEKAQIAGGDEDRQSGVKRVLVVGDSNITRVREGLLDRVKGDGRVNVVAQSGKCMVDAMAKAKDEVWENREGENLVVIHAGLNDVLKGRSQNLARQIELGLRKLREVSEAVQVEICTVPEVWGQSLQIEKRVVEANRMIRGLSRRFGYGVMEVNRVVYEARSDPFTWGIHYSGITGSTVGDRIGRHIVHFLGGPGALRVPV